MHNRMYSGIRLDKNTKEGKDNLTMRVRFLYDTKENKSRNLQDLSSFTRREAGGYYHDGW
jgi:hypothetical protein